jgi:hypothetical protein
MLGLHPAVVLHSLKRDNRGKKDKRGKGEKGLEKRKAFSLFALCPFPFVPFSVPRV